MQKIIKSFVSWLSGPHRISHFDHQSLIYFDLNYTTVDATSELISTHLEQRCYSLPVVTILETFFSPVLHVHTFYLLLGEKTCTKKKKEKHTHMTREHMEKGEKKVDKTEDKRVVHSFTFSLSFSYNRFFLSIKVYIKTVRP